MLTRPPPSLPVLPAALLPRWPAFELNSEKRRVSIWQYARGEDAPIQEVKTQLENNTFDPAHFDMLHVLNGLKYALRSPATPPKQRVLASQTWSSLYPRASPQDRTHLRLLLKPSEPGEPLLGALSQAWEYGPDISLYCLLGLQMPSRVLSLGLKGETIEDALRMAMIPALALLQSDSGITPENALSQAVCYGLPPEEYPKWKSFEAVIQVLDLPTSSASPLWQLTTDNPALKTLNHLAGYFMEQWYAQPQAEPETLALPADTLLEME